MWRVVHQGKDKQLEEMKIALKATYDGTAYDMEAAMKVTDPRDDSASREPPRGLPLRGTGSFRQRKRTG